MVTRIDSITPEQEKLIHPHVESYIKRGLSTEEADWVVWEEGARGCYRNIEEVFPSVVVHVPSILAGSVISPALYQLSQKYPNDFDVMIPEGSWIRAWRNGAGPDAEEDSVTVQVVRPGDAMWNPDAKPRIFYGWAREEGDAGSRPWRTEDGWDLGLSTPDIGTPGGPAALAYNVPLQDIKDNWHHHLNGQWGAGWQAFLAFFRDVLELELPDNAWDIDIQFGKAQMNASWWWPMDKVIVVSDRPKEIHTVRVGEHGRWAHNPVGPALLWMDGYKQYQWNDTEVPEDLILGKWTVKDIMAEDNTEVRRCAVDKMGWDRFIKEAGLEVIGEPKPDIANPGFPLTLYSLPEEMRIFEQPVNLLHCFNATLERDGSRREFGLTVPAEITDPVEAAAWLNSETVEDYLKTARAT